MSNVTAILLAAGKGSRMRSDRAKVLHELGGKPLVRHVIDSCIAASINDIVVVVGHDHTSVAGALDSYVVRFAHQTEQKGTGHAVTVAVTIGLHETVIVLCGDSPFVGSDLLNELIRTHQEQRNACTVIAAALPDPTGYGRLVTDGAGKLQKIVEQKDATQQEQGITLVNSGAYAFDRDCLLQALQTLRPTNAQGEYYLTDVIAALTAGNRSVGLLATKDPRAVIGINTPEQLAEAERLLRA